MMPFTLGEGKVRTSWMGRVLDRRLSKECAGIGGLRLPRPSSTVSLTGSGRARHEREVGWGLGVGRRLPR